MTLQFRRMFVPRIWKVFKTQLERFQQIRVLQYRPEGSYPPSDNNWVGTFHCLSKAVTKISTFLWEFVVATGTHNPAFDLYDRCRTSVCKEPVNNVVMEGCLNSVCCCIVVLVVWAALARAGTHRTRCCALVNSSVIARACHYSDCAGAVRHVRWLRCLWLLCHCQHNELVSSEREL